MTRQQTVSRILDAARGKILDGVGATSKISVLPCFALQAHHVQDNLIGAAPSDFHQRLIHLIRKAKHRVSLASLYVGPAVDGTAYSREVQLLQALEDIPSHVDVKVLMDANRGLRKVPIKQGSSNETTTTSAAQAVATAIHLQDNHQVYLCQILPNPLDTLLPNPLNEVAGVFHIKAYIIDDTLILSGANLSEEYFTDRHDRYLQISKGGNGLVDFYANLIDILCQDASDRFDPSSPPDPSVGKQKPIQPFWDNLHRLLASGNQSPGVSQEEMLEDPETVAICVPTFHHPQITPPKSSDNNHQRLPSDVEVTLKVLEESPKDSIVQLSSAYLNPSPIFLNALKRHQQVHFLTAGRLSHGFRPKEKAGNKGKAWIPTVFDHLQYQALWGEASQLWHWQRKGWTFHAKGLWILHGPSTKKEEGNVDTTKQAEVLAAIVGSSNFGRRSFERDVESNLILVFPSPESSLAIELQNEWELLKSHSQKVENPKQVLVDEAPPLPLHVRLCFPFIKSFF